MVKIGYKGNMKTFRIKVGNNIINRWGKDDIKEFSNEEAKHLLKNKDFYIIGNEELEVEKLIEESEIIEEEIKNFDYKKADKDALLDFTAVNDIEADYSMSVKELRVQIKEYLEEN